MACRIVNGLWSRYGEQFPPVSYRRDESPRKRNRSVAKSTGKKAVVKRSLPEKAKLKAPVAVRKLEETSVKTEKRPPVAAAKKAPRIVEAPSAAVPVPVPVPTDGKPRKNQAGLTSRELEFYRDMILAKRREIVGDMSSMEREALRTSGTNLSNLPLHMADMGTDNYEQEFTLGLVEKDRKLLRDLNDALAKIQNGTYGICEGTGKPISKARLEAQPWARFSIEHARKLEGRLR